MTSYCHTHKALLLLSGDILKALIYQRIEYGREPWEDHLFHLLSLSEGNYICVISQSFVQPVFKNP